MSGSDEDEAADSESVTVRESGIEVTKRFESERFPVPAVVFDIRSERDQPVGVRLTEQVPEGTAMDDIGFHPDFGSEFWTVEDHTLVLERAVLPDEDIETVYGLRGPDAENATPFLGEPAIEVWSETEDGTLFDDAGDPLLRSASTEADSNTDASEGTEDVRFHDEPGADNSDESEGDRSIRDGGSDGTESERTATLEPGDENDATETEGSETTSAGTASVSSTEEMNVSDEPTTETRTADDEPETNEETAAFGGSADGPPGEREETLAATLAAELRSGRVGEDDRETLSDVLGPRASLTARMERLRSQVDKVGAYTEALESFLDENGSAQQVLRRQTERTDALREEVETIDERTRSNRATLESVEEHSETIDDDLGAFRDAMADLDGIIEEIDDRQDRFEERLETIEEELSANADRFETIEDRLETIESTHQEDMEEQRTRLKARVDNGLDDVEAQIDSVAADVESLQTWRSQLSAVLGGPDGANNDSTESQ